MTFITIHHQSIMVPLPSTLSTVFSLFPASTFELKHGAQKTTCIPCCFCCVFTTFFLASVTHTTARKTIHFWLMHIVTNYRKSRIHLVDWFVNGCCWWWWWSGFYQFITINRKNRIQKSSSFLLLFFLGQFCCCCLWVNVSWC